MELPTECVSSWSPPTPASYDDVAYVLDIASQSSITITWTADTNQRDCEYDSSVVVQTSDYSSYDSFAVEHTEETFQFTDPTYSVSADAQTVIGIGTAVVGSYKVIYTMTDIVDTSATKTVEVNLSVIDDVCTPEIDVSNISLLEQYTYAIGDDALLIEGLENFSCGDCKSHVTF